MRPAVFPSSATESRKAWPRAHRARRPVGGRVRPLALAAALALALGSSSLSAATVTWTGPDGATWEALANWTPNLPLAADVVQLGAFNTQIQSGNFSVQSVTGTGRLTIVGGSLGVAAASSLGAFTLTGGSLIGAGDLVITGPDTSNWSGGSISRSGITTVNGPFALTGNGLHDLVGGQLVMAGTTTWTNIGNVNFGQIRVGNDAVLTNSGNFLDQTASDTSINPSLGGGGGTFANAGTYTKTGNTTTTVSSRFNNSGTLRVDAGTLSLSGGGSSGGVFDIASSATVAFAGGTHTLSGATGGTGTGRLLVSGGTVSASGVNSITGRLAISGGTLELAGSFNSGGFDMSGGTLGGSGAATLNLAAGSTGAWTNGLIARTGTTTVTGPFAVSGNGLHDVSGGRLVLAGTTTWTNVGNINLGQFRLGGGAVLENTGSFLDQIGSETGINGGLVGGGSFVNSGTYTKTGLAATTVTVAFDNKGLVNGTGSLVLNGGGTHTGTFSMDTGGVVALSGGTHSFSGNTLGASAGRLVLNGAGVATTATAMSTTTRWDLEAGSMTGAGSFALNGAVNWTATVLSGSGSTTFNGPLAIIGNGLHDMTQRSVNLAGTTTWTNIGNINFGQIRVGGGAVLTNSGIFLDQTASDTSINAALAGGGSFVNTGTYTKTGAGTTTLSLFFRNEGTVDGTGTLVLTGGGAHTGSFAMGAGGVVALNGGTHSFSGDTLGAGAGRLVLNGTGTATSATAMSTTTRWDLEAGTMNGAGSMALNGVSNWTGTLLSGAGSTTFGGALAITGNGVHDVSQRSVNFAGTTTWTNIGSVSLGQIRVGSGAVLTNSGNFLDQTASDTSINPSLGGGGGTFANAGTYTKTGNTTTTVSSRFNNSGTVRVDAGTLLLSGGGSSGGVFDIASSATVAFAGGTHTLSGATGGTGTGRLLVSGGTVSASGVNSITGRLAISGGTLELAGSFNSGGFDMSGGTLGGSGAATLNLAAGSTGAWTNGLIARTGTTTVTGPFAVAGNGLHDVSGGRLVLAGTTTWTNVGNINLGQFRLGGGAVLENTGSFLDQIGSETGINGGLVGGGSFVNSGTYTKTGLAATTVTVAFDNKGLVNGTGSLVLNGGGTHTGTFSMDTGGVVALSGGTHSFSGNTLGASAGRLVLNGAGVATTATAMSTTTRWDLEAGSMTGAGSFALNGAVNWTATVLSGSGSTTFNGPLAIIGNGLHDMTQRSVNLAGTTTWTNIGNINFGQIRVGGGAVLTNSGNFLDQTASDTSINAALAGGGSFVNTGTYTKTGAGTTTLSLFFRNEGTVDGTGTLVLTGGGAHTGSFAMGAGGAVFLSGGTHSFSGNTLGAGAGRLVLNGTGTATSATAMSTTTRWDLEAGTMNGAGSMALNGVSNWTGTLLSGAGSTTFGGALAITGNGVHDVSQRSVNFAGTTTWTNIGSVNFGQIRVGSGAVLTNSGNFIDQTASNTSINPSLGGGGGTFVNTGTYTKTAGGTTDLQLNFSNHGLVDVQTGRLNFVAASGLQGSGTLRIGTGGVAQLGGPSTAGVLDHNGGGGSLILGSNTLTVSGDYTNANFGVGDAFNRRANVSTSGAGARLIAAGDTNQALSGAAVSNGGTAAATMVIGNVHVGATTLNYNIVNSGSTGPALRGAVQTTVNGGNLTDNRLSGNGVAAGNWGPVAAGASLARDVVFAVGTAGVYAPISNQSVGIVNNFDNTRSQVLTISSAPGAAAYNLASASVGPAPIVLGNQRVGDGLTQALTITNTAPLGSFTEGLNASFGTLEGNATTNAGAVSLLAGGASNTTLMRVGVDSASAGTRTGAVTVQLASDGTGSSGLGITALASQTVQVSGNVYQVAQPTLASTNLSFGNRHVGDTGTQTLILGNSSNAPLGFQEKLNASFSSSTGHATAAGGVVQLGQGATDSSSLVIGLDTSAAGARSGTVTLSLQSDGTGTSGLTALNLTSQLINVSGGVYRLAQPSTPGAVNFGNVRVGTGASQALTITNSASNDGFSERLQATAGATTGGVTASGNFSQLGAGSSSSSIVVGINTATAGNQSGTASIGFISDGAGTSGLGLTPLASQNVQVNGSVYRVAAAGPIDAVVFGNRHVGDVVTQSLTITNTAASDGFSEKLNASFSGSTGAATFSGTGVNLLAAGASQTGGLIVGMDTSSAGSKTGSATVALQSDGTGTSGLAAIGAGTSTVNISGAVYRLAQPSTLGAVNFGNVRVGTGASQALSITNTAVNDGFSERLNASAGVTTGGVTASGTFSQLGAGSSDGSIVVGINTSTAGNKSGTAAIGFVSDGTGTSNLGQTPLTTQNVSVNGNVYRLAAAGPFNTVNFGNRHVGDAATQAVTITNTAAADGFSEKLNASFSGSTGAATFNGTGVNLLAAGASQTGGLIVGMDTSSAGAKTGAATVALQSDGTGTSGLAAIGAGSSTINISGAVYRLATANTVAPISFGAVHVGDTVTQSLTIANLANADGFSEKLNASFGGASDARITTGGSVSGLAAGASNTTGMVVGINTSAAGTISGNVTLNFASDGTGTSGLGLTPLSSQQVGVTAAISAVNVFRLANPVIGTAQPVNFGNVREGATASQALSITNNVVNDGFSERLNASAGATTGGVTASGSFSLLGAGSSDGSTIVVGINTATAGNKSGTAAIGFVSDGTGTSGLNPTTLATQNVQVNGSVFRVAAAGPINAVAFGNRHVGDVVSQQLTITNTAAADGFSEKLNASFSGSTGAATFGGTGVNLLAAGASQTGGLIVGMDTSSAGAKTGAATVALQSDGAGTSGLAAIGAGNSTVNISGAVYRLATANTVAPVSFGAVHVGDTVTQSLTIANLATADGFSERLNASFGGVSDARITTNGSVSGLAAGASNTTGMVVGINTSAAGTISGNVTLNFASDGAGTSGLGLTPLASQQVGVTAAISAVNVYRLANPVIGTAQPVDFGNVRIGAAAAQALSISNNVVNDGFSESLNASAGATTGGVTASGTFSLLGAGASNSSSIVVGINTATAGNKSGTATIGFVSDGTGTSGLNPTTLAAQNVSVNGSVYRPAAPTVDTSPIVLAARVGGSASRAIGVSNAAPADGFSEGLKASLGTAPTGFGASGSIANLAAGSSSAAGLQVALATGAAGTFSGTVNVTLASTGAGTSGLADLPLADRAVALLGKVYAAAVGQVQTTAVDFGIVHKGDSVGLHNITVSNEASAALALSDTLKASLSASGPFVASGNVAGLAAGNTDGTSLKVGLDTGNAGHFSQTATVAMASHNADMDDLGLAAGSVSLTGTVNNYANAVLKVVSGGGSLSSTGHVYVLDLGTLHLGDAAVSAQLGMANEVEGPADLLDGEFAFLDAPDFRQQGWDAFSDLEAGQMQRGLQVNFEATRLGQFSDVIRFSGIGHNLSGYRGALDDIVIELRGRVVDIGAVPEPGSLLLVLMGGLVWAGRRRVRALPAKQHKASEGEQRC